MEIEDQLLNTDDDHGLNLLIQSLSEYMPEESLSLVEKSYNFARIAHQGQYRKSGEDYVSHPVSVATILAGLRVDHETIIAAILHDVIEDTEYTKQSISDDFGQAVADLVDGVSKLTQIPFSSRVVAQAENFQKMAMAMTRDIRVIVIKLADRLHNIRTLGSLHNEKKRRIAQETLDIYAPIAMRLGINDFKVEYENRCFEAIYPMRAKRIKAALHNSDPEREKILDNICYQLELHFESLNIPARISRRNKHLYSIYQKMKTQRKSLADIMDVYACRIIVEDADTCYRALGAVHSLFKPISRKFKDYIAIPKANGYQSLHTVAFGERVPIEIQIRTQSMEYMADRGIAAHWLDKAGVDPRDNFVPEFLRAERWFSGLKEMHAQSGNSLEFIEHFKSELFSDEVYVFTPKGQILELPSGSTAVDMAYAVHTDIGHTCVACEINRLHAPLSQPLESGQTVKIIVDDSGRPNQQWLKFVVTGKARSNIRHHLKRQQLQDSWVLGEKMLNKALLSLELPPVLGLSAHQKDKVITQTQHKCWKDVLTDIGLGNRSAALTASVLYEVPNKSRGLFFTAKKRKEKKKKHSLSVEGTEGLVMNFASCCYPVPGDPILAYATGGQGIDVHRQTCKKFKSVLKKGKQAIELQWSEDVGGLFTVVLKVRSRKMQGEIVYLVNLLGELNTELDSIQSLDKDRATSEVMIQVKVLDRMHLSKIMKKLHNSKQIISVERYKSA
jgi:GTP diphosphokinase / guanosine-3',5'-bis(diphosphate) 3'-diphosphatase